MNPSFVTAAFWCTAAGLTALVVILFLLAHRPVALRATRTAGFAATFGALRLLLIAAGFPLRAGWDLALLAVTILSAVLLLAVRRVWLAPVDRDPFRQQVQDACRGLFLKVEETGPGCFELTAKGVARSLKLHRLVGRFHLVVLPPRSGKDRISLLVSWLDKQYPGPIPRVRIVLKRSEP